MMEIHILIADNPRVISGEDMLEHLAYSIVEAIHIVGAYTTPVRRICHKHTTGLRCFAPVLNRFYFKGDIFVESRTACVGTRYVDGLAIDVTGNNGHVHLSLIAVVVVNAFKQFAVEIGPVLKGEMLAVNARVNAGGNHGSLYGKCARAAHGVDKWSVALPAAEHDDAGGKHLADRRFGLRTAPATFMERFARTVERYRYSLSRDMNIENTLCAVDTHARALAVAIFIAKPVDNTVFYSICDKLGVAEVVAVGHCVD